MIEVHDLTISQYKEGTRKMVTVTTWGTVNGRQFVSGVSYPAEDVKRPEFPTQLARTVIQQIQIGEEGMKTLDVFHTVCELLKTHEAEIAARVESTRDEQPRFRVQFAGMSTEDRIVEGLALVIGLHSPKRSTDLVRDVREFIRVRGDEILKTAEQFRSRNPNSYTPSKDVRVEREALLNHIVTVLAASITPEETK